MKLALDTLNPQQREAVCHGGGPLLVLAGAGSGKTRVLTHRLAHLVRVQGVDPRHILAVTFTNKAAREMRSRVEQLIERLPRDVWIGTFHSICARMLRRHGAAVGVAPDFVVYDDSDQLSVIRECLAYHNLDEKRFQPRAVLGEIGRAKDQLVTPEQYSKRATGPFEEAAAAVYRLYQERLGIANALDFDDLIMRVVEMLDHSPETLSFYRTWFRHVLVDEYQDINPAQYAVLRRIAGEHRNLCVVGDDDQSIYAFRGADIGIILAFERDYPEAKVIKLERNYRSTSNILNAAWSVVSKNQGRTPKKLWTDRGDGEKIHLYEALDERDEAAFVLNRIESMMGAFGDGPRRTPKDFAVLYRINAQSRAMEEEFIRRQVPYRIVGGLRFYDRKEVKDALAYLRLVHNPADNVGFARIVNTPARGIGTVSLERLQAHAERRGVSLFEAAGQARDVEGLTPKVRMALGELHRTLQEIRDIRERTPVSILLDQILARTGYLEALRKERSGDSEARLENLKELFSVAADFERVSEDSSLAAFLEQVSLATDADDVEEGQEAVTLMTLHAAKGLEFPVVFLVGLEEGLLPHSRSRDDNAQLEEERRLCYVGMTRAKDRLFVSYASSRATWGERLPTKRSRFVEEVPASLFAPAAPGRSPAPHGPSRSTSLWERMSAPSERKLAEPAAEPPPKPPFRVGQKVTHAKFGAGLVINCTPGGSDCQVTVAFETAGVKKLSLAFAKLEPVP